jgi:D-beta-D-heptose 7-phosphate kinase/D-beta-D-heptose 1-phosphate adenosyltransferase
VGTDFRSVLRKSKISDRHLIVDHSRRTVLKERIVSDRQQMLRVDYEDLDAVSGKVARQLSVRALELVSECDLVILEDYAKGLITPAFAAELFRAAARAGRKVLVDPNARSPLSLYRGAALLTPNTREAEALSGVRIVDAGSLAEAGAVILKATRAPALIITRGKEGMAIFEKGRRTPRLIETYAREVYDVSGAGDTVISVLGLALAAGAGLDDAARLANLAAAIEVGKRGTATVSRDELATALSSWA